MYVCLINLLIHELRSGTSATELFDIISLPTRFDDDPVAGDMSCACRLFIRMAQSINAQCVMEQLR